MAVVVYVPENVSSMGRVLEIRAQVRTMVSRMQSERSEEGLIVAEGALKVREEVPEDFPWALLVAVDVSLEGGLGHGSLHSPRFQIAPQDPLFVRTTGCNGAHLSLVESAPGKARP